MNYIMTDDILKEILTELKAEGLIDTEIISLKNGEMVKFEIKNPKALDEKVFSDKQKKLLRDICNKFGSWSTDKIVTQTHLEAPWFFSKSFEKVDYSYAKDIEFFLT